MEGGLQFDRNNQVWVEARDYHAARSRLKGQTNHALSSDKKSSTLFLFALFSPKFSPLKHFPKPEDPLIWIDELSDRNYVVIDDFLDDQVYHLIKSFFLERVALFRQAGIGALHQHQIQKNIRGDLTYWLDRQRDTELAPYWQQLQETVDLLNRYCFLSLSGFEFHLAHYPAGSFYERHLDQFSNRSNRIISMIIYLNDNWQTGDGGELEIVGENGEVVLVEPLARRCVLFKSAEVLHGVLPAHKSRYSLTGWLLRHPTGVGYLLG